MELIRNLKESEFGIEGEVYFGLFGKYIDLSIENTVETEYAKKCASYLNSLSEELIDSLCAASIRYCNSFLSAIGEPEKSFSNPKDVLALIYPSVLIVPYVKHPNVPIIHLELNCEWEEEHGLEWIVREDKVLYVGAFNGEDPWSDFSKKEAWNYA